MQIYANMHLKIRLAAGFYPDPLGGSLLGELLCCHNSSSNSVDRTGGGVTTKQLTTQQLPQFGVPNWGGGVEVLSLSSQHNNFNVVCELGEGWRLCATVCWATRLTVKLRHQRQGEQ